MAFAFKPSRCVQIPVSTRKNRIGHADSHADRSESIGLRDFLRQKRPTTEVIDLKKGRRSGCNGLRQAWLPQEDQRRENSIPASSSFFCVSSRSLPDRAAVRTL